MPAADYGQVRRAVLRRYELTVESYRRKFRQAKHKEDTFSEWSVHLIGFLEIWLDSAEIPQTFEGLKEATVMEQSLENSLQTSRFG